MNTYELPMKKVAFDPMYGIPGAPGEAPVSPFQDHINEKIYNWAPPRRTEAIVDHDSPQAPLYGVRMDNLDGTRTFFNPSNGRSYTWNVAASPSVRTNKAVDKLFQESNKGKPFTLRQFWDTTAGPGYADQAFRNTWMMQPKTRQWMQQSTGNDVYSRNVYPDRPMNPGGVRTSTEVDGFPQACSSGNGWYRQDNSLNKWLMTSRVGRQVASGLNPRASRLMSYGPIRFGGYTDDSPNAFVDFADNGASGLSHEGNHHVDMYQKTVPFRYGPYVNDQSRIKWNFGEDSENPSVTIDTRNNTWTVNPYAANISLYAAMSPEISQAHSLLNQKTYALQRDMRLNPDKYRQGGWSDQDIKETLALPTTITTPQQAEQRLRYYVAHPHTAELLGDARRAVSYYSEIDKLRKGLVYNPKTKSYELYDPSNTVDKRDISRYLWGRINPEQAKQMHRERRRQYNNAMTKFLGYGMMQ